MIERPDFVRVTNGNKDKIVGRFDGEDFEFIPGKATDIPVVVAAHLFGFGREDKIPALNRLGWLQSSEHFEKALAKLRKISFAEAPPLVEAQQPDPVDDSVSDLLAVSGSTGHPVSPDAGGGREQPARLLPPKPR